MDKSKAVVGVFTYIDDLVRAIEGVKGSFEFRAYSPFASHEIEEAAAPERSPVRIITLIGATVGLVSGFALAILTALDWPLRVSAKAIVSIPAFIVVGYECTILFGAIFTLLALFHFCRLPDVLRKVGYDPRFSADKFGMVVACGPGDVDRVQSLLRDSGAEEVNVREAL